MAKKSIEIAAIYEENQHFNSAIEFYEDAIKAANEINDLFYLYKGYRFLAETYIKMRICFIIPNSNNINNLQIFQ